MNTIAIYREGEAPAEPHGNDVSTTHPRSTPRFHHANGCLEETSLPSLESESAARQEPRPPGGITRLTDLAESLGFVPWLGDDIPRTIPNLLQHVLEGRQLSPAQSDYTFRLLTAAVLELLSSSPIATSIRDPKSEIRNHTDPLFLRVAHRAASPNLSTLNPQLSTNTLAAPTGPYEVQLDPSGFPNSERGTVGIFPQESGVRNQESATNTAASAASAPAPVSINHQPSTINHA